MAVKLTCPVCGEKHNTSTFGSIRLYECPLAPPGNLYVLNGYAVAHPSNAATTPFGAILRKLKRLSWR
jgi:hypothetical protein